LRSFLFFRLSASNLSVFFSEVGEERNWGGKVITGAAFFKIVEVGA
jgi:hypothetical protein